MRVGFLTLRVVRAIPTPGDYAPYQYELIGLGANADRRYIFTPHKGIERSK